MHRAITATFVELPAAASPGHGEGHAGGGNGVHKGSLSRTWQRKAEP